MRSICTLILAAGISFAAGAFPLSLCAQELEIVNRPVNTLGLTGLLETTAPFTLPKGTIEFGAGLITEQSYTPDYSVSTQVAVISYGLSDSVEIALRSVHLSEKESHITRRNGMGDAELLLKWNVLPPVEYSSQPSVAVFAGGTAPTGDRREGTNSVMHWGGRFGLAVGSEIFLEDYVLGAYADGQVLMQDLSDKEKRDWYHRANAGILLPISKYRNLQLFVEYNRQKGKDVLYVHDEDHSSMTYGLRLVSAHFNLTVGTQFIHHYVEGVDNTSRISGMVTVKY